jgi:hypothetical protein
MALPLGILFGFVTLLTVLTAGGWALSAALLLQHAWLLLPPAFLLAALVARRHAGSWTELSRQTIEPFTYWPTCLVLATLAIAAASYPPTMLDSLTYRLPQMLLWSQAGAVHYIPTAEDRLNFMSQSWGLCTLPIVQLGGIRLAWFWNLASWIIGHVLFYHSARAWVASPRKAHQISFLASTSTFALLQASSTANDLLGAVLILVALYFILLFETTKTAKHIGWAILTLCLAAGVKAHLATLGLPFALWFFLSRSRPWLAFRWRWAPLLAAVALLCSPLPGFALNHKHFGSFTGPATDKSFAGKGPAANLGFGCALMLWQNLQPCVNPLGLILDKRLEQAVVASGVREISPRFNLRMLPINMVDGSSLGLLTASLVALGIVIAWKRNPALAKSWPFWAAASGAIGFFIATAQVMPAAIGRSSGPFLYLLFPLALAGWALLPDQWLRHAVQLSLAGSLAAVMMAPEHPLWPVRWARSVAERTGLAEVSSKLAFYERIGERRIVGTDLIKEVPHGETRVFALISEDRPLLGILWPQHSFAIELVDDATTLADFKAQHPNTVITGGPTTQTFPELSRYLEQSGEFERLDSRQYTSKLLTGPETWSLYHRKSAISNTATASAPAQGPGISPVALMHEHD